MSEVSKTMVVKLLEGKRTIKDFENMRERLHRENEQQFRDFLSRQPKDSNGPIWKKLTYNDGGTYMGENSTTNPQWRDGIGWYEYPGGDKYFGQWKNDKYHGKGTYIFSNGERYEGEYENALRDGYGKFYAFNGGIYEGYWSQDKRHGQGQYSYFGTAETYIGMWENNMKHGKGLFTYAYGDIYEGDFRENDRSGYGK